MTLPLHRAALLSLAAAAFLALLAPTAQAASAVPPTLGACMGEADVLKRLSCLDAGMAQLDGLRACSAETDSLKRLVCFDNELRRLGGVAAPAPAVAPPAPVAPAAMAAGTALAAAPVAAPAPALGDEKLRGNRRSEDAAERTMTAKVQAVQAPPVGRVGQMQLTLENGQVWRVTDSGRPFEVEAGDTVRVESGVLGSYLMTKVVEGRERWVRVSRVR